MEKKEQDLRGQVPTGHAFVPTEMGSARFVSLDGEGSSYKYETGSTEMVYGSVGPPWSIEPSIRFLCDEVGVDFHRFVAGLAANKNDMEMAAELGVDSQLVDRLKEQFYKNEAIMGNYGQD
ncbi:MAG TPA: hypothetical protein PLJ33_01760 [Peptococcaceae bacterium]|jgi:hypothetical protein|nr:hypothetical protein [Peptococcaceae bacterium]HPZ71704.1 hypothetical protein [Peptococcaceae bacterium]HQD53565.1 hypothetical protein [Peptococcaceae bacterium]